MSEELNAPELAARALDKELNSKPLASSIDTTVVNDLTTMVKKKKKPADQTGSGDVTGKRKADEAAVTESKKAKTEASDV